MNWKDHLQSPLTSRRLLVWTVLAFAVLAAAVVALAGGGEKKEDGASGAFEVAYLPCGRINDKSWSQAGWEGVQEAKNKLGIKVALSESVQPADIEAAMRDYASKGYKVILAHCGTFVEAAQKVAKDFPNVWFEGAGLPAAPLPNVFAYDPQQQDGSFLAGVLAGLMTKSNKVGVVAAFNFAGIVRQAEGFRLGARFVNPRVAVAVTYINSWEDTAKGKEAALSQISAGADIIYTATDQAAAGAFEAATDKGVFAIAQYADQSELAPKTLLTSVLYQQGAFLTKVIDDARAGKLEKSSAFKPGLKEGVGTLAPFRELDSQVPAKAKECLKTLQDDIIAGKVKIPGTDVMGKERAGRDIDTKSLVTGGTHPCLNAKS
jgi:basic membrane protein A and related proteins